MSNLIHRYRHLGTANEGFKSNLHDRAGLIEDILTRVVIDSIRRYQERLQVGIQDSVADLLSSFKLQIVDKIYQASQDWMIVTHRSPILFPPRCRYLYTLAGNTLVVVEQEPIVRTLRLDQALFHNKGSRALEGLDGSIIESKRLAIPYTVFILHFRNSVIDGSGIETFMNLYIGWRSSPLTSLDDDIYAPYLPNIHLQNYTVCTGRSGRIPLSSSHLGGGAISELTQRVITDFWNSDFNTDLSTHWYKKDRIPQLATVEEWEKNSREDPLFILTVPLWLPTTVNNLIKTICNSAEDLPETIDLRHRISEMTDGLSEQLFRGIKNYVFRTKFDRFYPKDVTDNLATVMENVAKQLHTIALGIEIQLDSINEELDELQIKDYKWRKRGSVWND